ncbi:hypothetical protein AHYW_002603 [Providencia manganoxydans]
MTGLINNVNNKNSALPRLIPAGTSSKQVN